MLQSRARVLRFTTLVLVLSVLAGCGKKPPATPPSTAPAPAPFPDAGGRTDTPPPAAPTTPRNESVTAPPTVAPPVSSDPLANMGLDEVNRGNALKPVFFLYDSDQLDDLGRQALTENAQTLKKYASWIVTIEGHCDERGTAEYNLALGDRRAQAARTYLVSLGIPADRLKTVSYGNEFPFDPGHDEAAWAQNRRAQFMVTAK